jgi:hypothetical protein
MTSLANRLSRLAVVATPLLAVAPPALATTKGLSQIVTPDVQPAGQLSLSLQGQAKHIGNPYEAQAELGLTPWFEVAAFQGFSPHEGIFGAELSLLNKDPWLLSAGFVNWSTEGDSPQPFIEGGYYGTHNKLIAGGIIVDHRGGWAGLTISTRCGACSSITRAAQTTTSPSA